MRFHALNSNTVASARKHSHARMNCAWSETERLYMLSMRIMRETERTPSNLGKKNYLPS